MYFSHQNATKVGLFRSTDQEEGVCGDIFIYCAMFLEAIGKTFYNNPRDEPEYNSL